MTALLAYGCALIAVLFFGSNFVPVKKYETSDGVFFQFVMCLGIFCFGMVVNAVRGMYSKLFKNLKTTRIRSHNFHALFQDFPNFNPSQ